MKHALAPSELPFIGKTPIQLEYRFPLCIYAFRVGATISIGLNLIRTLGCRRILVSGYFNEIYDSFLPEVDIDYICCDVERAEEFRIIRDVMPHYDAIICDVSGWETDMFESCQEHRCMVIAGKPVVWSGRTGGWTDMPITRGLSHPCPTSLAVGETGGVYCNGTLIHNDPGYGKSVRFHIEDTPTRLVGRIDPTGVGVYIDAPIFEFR